MTEEQYLTLIENIDTLGSLITGLYALVVVLGLYLAWSLHRIARNQVDAAKLLEQGVARIENDIEP